MKFICSAAGHQELTNFSYENPSVPYMQRDPTLFAVDVSSAGRHMVKILGFTDILVFNCETDDVVRVKVL